MRSETALRVMCLASQETCMSNVLLNHESWKAQGTALVTTPCFGQVTRGTA